MKAATSIPRILAAWLLGSVGALAAGCGADGTADGASLPPDDRVQAVGQVAEGRGAGAPDAAPEIAPALADGRFPPDFGLDVTVLLGPGAPELLDAQDRQAKYIVLPDGSLHSDASPFIDVSTRPGRARWLYEDQMQFVWSLCTQTGFAEERDIRKAEVWGTSAPAEEVMAECQCGASSRRGLGSRLRLCLRLVVVVVVVVVVRGLGCASGGRRRRRGGQAARR